MIHWVRKFFVGPTLLEIQGLLDVSSPSSVAIAISRKGPPHGDHVTYKAIRTAAGSIATLTTRNTVSRRGGSPAARVEVRLDARRIDELCRLLDVDGFWTMRDDLGRMLDGVHFHIAYATQTRAKFVRIWNPRPSTPQLILVESLWSEFDGLWK